MTADIDSLIGGRPDTPDDEIDALCKRIAGGQGSFVDAGVLMLPVTTKFLATVFEMDQATVKKRLLTVKPVRIGGTEKVPRPLYDFKEACSYLVKPNIDLDLYIRSMDVNKLPNLLNKIYWEAKRTRLRYELEAGDAWRTEDVLAVFGLVFMTIKDRIQLWSETMREAVRLNDEQYARFQQMTDDLQGDLHEHLCRIPAERQTQSLVVEAAGTEVVE